MSPGRKGDATLLQHRNYQLKGSVPFLLSPALAPVDEPENRANRRSGMPYARRANRHAVLRAMRIDATWRAGTRTTPPQLRAALTSEFNGLCGFSRRSGGMMGWAYFVLGVHMLTALLSHQLRPIQVLVQRKLPERFFVFLAS